LLFYLEFTLISGCGLRMYQVRNLKTQHKKFIRCYTCDLTCWDSRLQPLSGERCHSASIWLF